MQTTSPARGARHLRGKAGIKLGFVLVAACLAVLALQAGKADAAQLKGVVSVNTAKLYMRQRATTGARIVATVYRGTVLKVLSDNGTWCNVVTTGGKAGWCQSRYLIGISAPSAFKTSNTARLEWPSECINLIQPFTFQRCMQDMEEIASRFDARIETVGTSVMGNPIKAIVFGNPEAETRIFIQASMHAREWLTAMLALRHAESMQKAASLGATYKGMAVSDMLKTVQVWVLPVANPDGMRLVSEGLASVPASMPQMKTTLKAMNGGSTSFTRWKANARGVDLNRNFDAQWRVDPYYKKPGPQNYSGPAPFSEPESVALKNLTEAGDFELTVSYHSSGKLLYWYNHKGGENGLNRRIAEQLRALNGYTIVAPSVHTPNGGYRDWFVEKYLKPGLTLEMGSGTTPLPQSNFYQYWQDNRYVLYELVWSVAPKTIAAAAE